MIIFGWQIRRAVVPGHRAVSLNSACPACGHAGCKLRFVGPQTVQVGEKGKIQITEPMVERICNTCGATCYEKTVVEPEKWIPK